MVVNCVSLRTFDHPRMCMSSILSCIRHRLVVNTCADGLKSLPTAAELAGVQYFMIKAFATEVSTEYSECVQKPSANDCDGLICDVK